MQTVLLIENLIIAACYLIIAILVGIGLFQARTGRINSLGLATFGIFLTCSGGHFVHALGYATALSQNLIASTSDASSSGGSFYPVLVQAWYWYTTALGQFEGHAVTSDHVNWGQAVIDGLTIIPAVTFLALRRRYGLLAHGEGVILEYERKARYQRKQAQELRTYSADLEQRIKEWMAINNQLKREVAERTRAEAALTKVNEELSRGVATLQRRTHEITVLNNLGNLLQSCRTTIEAYTVTARLAKNLLPDLPGVLYMLDETRAHVKAVAGWGMPLVGPWPSTFPVDACWALRRGRAYAASDARGDVLCGHLTAPLPTASLCIPLIVQSTPVGLVQLQRPEIGEIGEEERVLAEAMVERLELTLTNLNLLAALWDQSVRDPLTRVFNRRYMEESLERELHEADRVHGPVSVILLDLDHFKELNDTAGHAAGDAVLAAVGNCLQQNVRREDIVCRYGGEEFVLILPSATPEAAYLRAEQIREMMRYIEVSHYGDIRRPITASLGVAAYPTHGTTRSQVLQAADTALYTAKTQGRNRVVMAMNSMPQPKVIVDTENIPIPQ